MKFSIWRVSDNGDSFPITSAGSTTLREVVQEKCDSLNEKLISSDPDSTDRYVVRDDRGRDLPSKRRTRTQKNPKKQPKSA